MLTSLLIKDFAIIDELELSFGPGLNVMTGETGAGKTIIVEALKLILGGRASLETIRSGSDRASVTAIFNSSDLPKEIKAILDNAGIECGDELIIHRVIGQQGKARISINGVATTAAVLASIASRMVDISSQHEHQLLLEESAHPFVLDSFGGLLNQTAKFREVHASYSSAARELLDLESNERAAKEKLDFIKFQLDELVAADIKPDEDKAIEAERSRMKHAVLLQEKVSGAEFLLAGEEGATAIINRAAQLVAQCSPYEQKSKEWGEALERARIELQDVGRELTRYTEGLNSNPEKFLELEERLHTIRALVRKHGGSIESLVRRCEELRAEVDKVTNYDDILEKKRNEVLKLESARRKEALALSTARKTAAKKMSEGVARELSELGMKKTQFVVVCEARKEEEWDESGPDRVELLISPNIGEPARPLARIASGGELSRVMLALKSALAAGGSIPGTSVFDEVDSGIGGAVASAVGKKLKRLSGERQVVCITHLPQVAVYADSHLRISKRAKSGRTITMIEDLAFDARVGEVARMLGGEKITDVAVKHAREMLDHVKK